MRYIAFFVGIAAVIICLLSYQQKTRKRIILFNATSRVLYILQYLLLSAFEGAVFDVVGIAACVLAQKKDKPSIKKHLKPFIIGVNIIIAILGFITYKNVYSLLAIAGILLHTSAFWITNETKIRQVSLLGCPFWLAYNMISGAYGSVIGDALSIVSLLVAMFRYDINTKETRLLVVRHGESEANRQGIFAGHTDVDLVDRGIEQATLTAKYIVEKYKVDKIYSSDLLRAYKTAECISNKTDIEVIKEPKLREIFGGSWEGERFDRLISIFPEDFSVWKDDIGNATCTDGESVKELGERIFGMFSQIAKDNVGKTVVIVTHATPIRAAETIIRTGSLGRMAEIPFVSNASLTEIIWKENKFELIKIGEDSHLQNLKTNSLA